MCHKSEINKSNLDYWGMTYYKSRDTILNSDLEYMFTQNVQMFQML